MPTETRVVKRKHEVISKGSRAAAISLWKLVRAMTINRNIHNEAHFQTQQMFGRYFQTLELQTYQLLY